MPLRGDVGSACHVILTASFRRREPSANSATQFGLVTSFILQVMRSRWMIALLCDHEAAQMMQALARSRADGLQPIGMM